MQLNNFISVNLLRMTTEKKNDPLKITIIALLALNLLLGIYVAFFKHDALRLETLKAGGRDNMELAVKLYESAPYISRPTSTLDQILQSMNQPAATAPTTDTTKTEAQQNAAQ